MPSYYDYEDYETVAEDSEDLYSYDDTEWQYDDVEVAEHKEWENYYHNIADEITEE